MVRCEIEFPVDAELVCGQEVRSAYHGKVGRWTDVFKLPHDDQHRAGDVLAWYPVWHLLCYSCVVEQ